MFKIMFDLGDIIGICIFSILIIAISVEFIKNKIKKFFTNNKKEDDKNDK